jgi:hypothetical protein
MVDIEARARLCAGGLGDLAAAENEELALQWLSQAGHGRQREDGEQDAKQLHGLRLDWRSNAGLQFCGDAAANWCTVSADGRLY